MISMRSCRRAGRALPQAFKHMAADRVPSHRVIFSPQRTVRYVAGRVMRWRQDRDGLRSPELLDIEPLMPWYCTQIGCALVHSPSGPTAMSPSMVCNGCECMHSASLSSSRVFVAAIASPGICNSL
jgi:hypothetical protein